MMMMGFSVRHTITKSTEVDGLFTDNTDKTLDGKVEEVVDSSAEMLYNDEEI